MALILTNVIQDIIPEDNIQEVLAVDRTPYYNFQAL